MKPKVKTSWDYLNRQITKLLNTPPPKEVKPSTHYQRYFMDKILGQNGQNEKS